MTGRCKDCAYWRNQRLKDRHFCARLLKDRNDTNYADGYGEHGHWLITGPEFGCVEFEEKA